MLLIAVASLVATASAVALVVLGKRATATAEEFTTNTLLNWPIAFLLATIIYIAITRWWKALSK